MSTAIKAHSRSLSSVINRACVEAQAPLDRQIQVLDKALSAAVADGDDFQGPVEILEQKKAALAIRLAKFEAGNSPPRLILPGHR